MNIRVLVFAGSRSQLLQHIPVERTVRSFRAWEPRLVLSSEKGDHALWAPCSKIMTSRRAVALARPRPPFPMRACWPTSWAVPAC